MGIKKEIERRRRAKQEALNWEIEQERKLTESIDAVYIRHEEIARNYALPFVQKLSESGAIGVLEDLREDMDLYYCTPERSTVTTLFGRKKREKRIDPTPAKLGVISEVQVGSWSSLTGEVYAFSGLDLELMSRPVNPQDKYSRSRQEQEKLDFLQQCFRDISARGEDSMEMIKCYTALVWDYKEGDGFPYTYGGCQYERL